MQMITHYFYYIVYDLMKNNDVTIESHSNLTSESGAHPVKSIATGSYLMCITKLTAFG